jgi:hypothetical protein
MTTTTTTKQQQSGAPILNLPNELLLYLLRNFLDLADLWCLFQTSQELRLFSSTVIGTTWKIETRRQNDHMIKLQCRTALIKLQSLSNQLSFHQQDQIPIIRKSFLIEPTLVSNTSTAIVHFLTIGSSLIGSIGVGGDGGGASSNSIFGQVVDEVEEEDNEEETIVQYDDHASKQTDAASIPQLTQRKKKKIFQDLITQESQLHTKIIQGIASYKHKFVLIEDIDIRNRIRTAVDIVFHHAVFVSAISHSNSIQNRASAAVLVRLLTKLDLAFPSYCREITYTLADNIKAFLEYTGYKILVASNNSKSLKVTLASISACFDLMGAAFVGKILSDSHVDCAVQRTCELLANTSLNAFKKSLLTDLLDHWLTIKREIGSGELCRYIRLEIEKCGSI